MTNVTNSAAALTEAEAAAYLRVSRSFLRQSRMNGSRKGHAPPPPYSKIGRMVRYQVKDLDEWLESHRQAEVA